MTSMVRSAASHAVSSQHQERKPLSVLVEEPADCTPLRMPLVDAKAGLTLKTPQASVLPKPARSRIAFP